MRVAGATRLRGSVAPATEILNLTFSDRSTGSWSKQTRSRVGIEGVVQAGGIMRVEIVADQRDGLRCGVVFVEQPPDFLHAVELSGNRGPVLELQGRRPLAHELLADANHLSLGKADRLGDFPVPPTSLGIVFVQHQQHPRPARLRRHNRQPTTNRIQLTPLPGRQPDLELLRRVRRPCRLDPVILAFKYTLGQYLNLTLSERSTTTCLM